MSESEREQERDTFLFELIGVSKGEELDDTKT